MEALVASYCASSDEEEDCREPIITKNRKLEENKDDSNNSTAPSLPSPLTLLDFPSISGQKNVESGNRIRSFPHIEGNYALHVYIPVNISSIVKRELAPLLKKAGLLVPQLHTIGTDLPLSSANTISNDDMPTDVPTLAEQYHISLSRTVAIRAHQIDSIIAMLRHKLHTQKRYWIEFGKWEVFINDDQTRSFLALEVTSKGLSEISKQIRVVDEVFRLHNLPEFYKNPRPHISVAWGLGDITPALNLAADELQKIKGNVKSNRKGILSCTFSGIECKIGRKIYPICKMTM